MTIANRAFRIACALLLGASVGCRQEPKPEPAPPPIETKEVGAAPDATLSTEGDVVERRRASTFSGVLPGGFPKDLPVYEPSSLVDFGQDAQGSFVVFQTPDDSVRVRARYPAAIAAHGWMREGGDAFSRGGRRVRVSFENLRPGTKVRVSY
jgi:hypothetical protein